MVFSLSSLGTSGKREGFEEVFIAAASTALNGCWTEKICCLALGSSPGAAFKNNCL